MEPVRVHVRMYQVGFGDCFLLTIEYDEADAEGRAERQVLIDFGSTRSPEQFEVSMADVAERIQADCGGRLDLVMVTHRHKDHLGGFGVKAAAEIMTALAPKLVLRPWTEDPTLADDASGPVPAPETALGLDSRRFVTRLAETQGAVARLAEELENTRGFAHELHLAAVEQVPNAAAIATLDALAEDGRGRYLHAGMNTDVTDVVPGLEITVLGPATLEQDPGVAKQADEHDEFWILRLHDSLAAAAGAGERRELPECEPGPVRWLVTRLGNHRLHSVARLVRRLDDALNNTSLNLLLKVGGVDMLFPGDAQIENWQSTLAQVKVDADLEDRLRNIDLYKVGHHGSRNATPRSLHRLWTEREPDRPPLTALMSTRPGVHGESDATAVPRATLVTELGKVAKLLSTAGLPEEKTCLHLVAEAKGGPFAVVE